MGGAAHPREQTCRKGDMDMPVCQNHPGKKKVFLCMGCGNYFCKECGREVHGVFYCKGCETTASEFAEAKEKETDEIDPEQARWEAGFSSASMVVINRKSLKKIVAPLPLEDIFAGAVRRIMSYVIDWIITVPKVSIFLRYRLGNISEEDFLNILIAEIAFAFLYFLFFNFSTGMTFGKLFANTRLVESSGKQVSFLQAFGRAIVSLVTMPMPLLHGLVFLLSSSKQGFHDLILGTYVVLDEPWKKMAKEAISSGGKYVPRAGPAPAVNQTESPYEEDSTGSADLEE